MSENHMQVSMRSISKNEALARMMIAAFAAQLDPTIEELADIKTAVSEAVTNAIVHGYECRDGEIVMLAEYAGRLLTVEISDKGKGIADVERAREPFFTTLPEGDRSGMGFTVMETFMDTLKVTSTPGEGTTVRMTKVIMSGNGPKET